MINVSSKTNDSDLSLLNGHTLERNFSKLPNINRISNKSKVCYLCVWKASGISRL